MANAFNNFFIKITEKLNIQEREKGNSTLILKAWKLLQPKNNPFH